MKALLDTNVLLDVLLNREPWVQAAQGIWKACDEGRLHGLISAITISNIFYIVRKASDLQRARESVELCLEAYEIAEVQP